MNNRLRLKDNIKINGKNFLISTVELPDIYKKCDIMSYETCIFKGDDSNVVMRYNTKEEATDGHTNILENIKDYIW